VIEPDPHDGHPASVLSAQLSRYRETVLAKVMTLDERARRVSLVPSGWTPLELVHHLTCMELRWFVWGFLAEDLAEPWLDSQGTPSDPWRVPDGVQATDIADRMRAAGARTTAVLRAAPLDTVASVGGRFSSEPPTLAWIAVHVLQEYARHAGHLDIAVELAGGPLGE
jgi:hypothetical protein